MRQIVTDRHVSCQECDGHLPPGASIFYEKNVGSFCLDHAPSVETIRRSKQEAADVRAEKIEAQARKYDNRAQARFDLFDQAFRDAHHHDHGLVACVPRCEEMFRSDDLAYAELGCAERLRKQAERVRRGVRVRGDAVRARHARRDAILARLVVGQIVWTRRHGKVEILKLFRRSAHVIQCRKGHMRYADLLEIRFEEEDTRGK